MPYDALVPPQPTLLVVDDALENLKVLSKTLQEQGYAVRCARSGAVALAGARAAQPDLILLDIRMPGMDGYTVCQRLKADPSTAAIPVIFLSALDEALDKVRAFAAGAVDYITKPFQVEELLARVAHQLTIRRLQQQMLAQNQRLQQEICDRTQAEARLHQATAQLSTLIEHLQVGVILEDRDRRVQRVNQPCCDLLRLGVPSPALLGTDGRAIAAASAPLWGDAAAFARRAEAIAAAAQPVIAEEIVLTDGRTLERDYGPICGAQGLEGHLWQYRDITARKQAERILLQNSQALNQFSESLKQLHRLSLARFDSFEALLRDYLATGCRVLGFADGWVSRVDGDGLTVVADQSGHCAQAYFPLADTFCALAIEAQATVAVAHTQAQPELCDRPIYRRLGLESYLGAPIAVDGAVFGCLCFFSPQPRPQGFCQHEQEILELMAQSIGTVIGRDRLTQQQYQAEAQIKRQEAALRLIVEGTAAKTGRAFFESLVHYLADVLQVRNAIVTQLQPTGDRVSALAFWQNGELGGELEYALAHTPCERVVAGQVLYVPEGVQRQFPLDPELGGLAAESFLGIPLVDAAAAVIGHLAVIDDKPMVPDQTRELILRIFAARAAAELERQQAEDALRQARETADAANRAKSIFLANMSHELRTPLNTILGFAQLIARDCSLEAEARDYLAIIGRSGEHLLALINDVLEMSKIEAGRISLHVAPCDVAGLLGGLEAMLRLQAEAKGLRLRFDCDPALPPCIAADQGKLRQVLINLLGNAIKFTQRGEVRLRVRCLAAGGAEGDRPQTPAEPPATQTQLEFAVIDTGPGIAPEELDRLFEPFSQTQAGLQSHQGSGLGLPLSQQFVRLMGGELSLETQPGEGSTFTFVLPVVPVERGAVLPEAAAKPILGLAAEGGTREGDGTRGGDPVGTWRMLVVEDHPANRHLLVRLLESAGFAVQAAPDGEQAIALAEGWRPHLIWMDIRMPGIDGYEATRQIRALGLDPAPTIIALTASPFEEERAGILAAGCDDFVRKPFDLQGLLQKIAAHLPVRYRYAAVAPEGEGAAPADPGPWLRARPDPWRRQLTQAAITGSDDRLLALLAEPPAAPPPIHQALATWIKDFEFDRILACLDPPGGAG